MRSVQPALRAALLTCALLLALPLPATARTLTPARASVEDALGGVLDRAVARGAPGAILVVDTPIGRWSAARGQAERGGEPMMPEHRFRIASVTKLFVAVVTLQLVQEGWLSLDHSVEQWLPGLVPRGDAITVRQLLRHTSGLYDYMDGPFMRGVLAEPGRVWQPAELVAYATSQRPLFRPGAPGRWSYSNTNYVVLGLLVERVTGQPLAHEVRFRLIDRLGLGDTAFEPDDPAAGLAHGYQRRRDLSGLTMSFAWGAGNMTSTAADLARFSRALFGGELLDDEHLAQLTAFGSAGGVGWSPSLSYGLGLMRETLRLGDRSLAVYGHTGMLGGYRTALWYAPEYGVTVVAMLNEQSANPTLLATEALVAALPGFE